MKIVLAILVVQLALALADHQKREKRSILVPPRFRYPPIIRPPGPFFPIAPRIPLTRLNMSASELYNPSTEMCCRGKVHLNPKHSKQACCGDNVFDQTKHLCCDGVVKEITSGADCCGQETYNIDQAICCNNKVVPVTEEERDTVECCGENKYDPSKSLCCGGFRNDAKVLEKKNDDDFCCGMEVANGKTQACCGDLTTRGGTVLNSSYHVVTREENSNKTVCCWGGLLYDPAEQTCCSTKLVDGANKPCCGDDAIDGDNQLCCIGDDGEAVAVAGNPLEQRCCGSKAADLEKQMCCKGQVFDRDDETSFCCGEKPFNTKDAFCLVKITPNATDIEIVKKQDETQNALCGEEPYSMENQKCCPTFDGLKVVQKSSSKSNLCCGDQTYEWKKGSLCCMDPKSKQVKLHENMNMMSDCCGLETFDASTQICCGGKVQERGETTECCANSDIYDAKTDLCCVERRFSRDDELKFAVMTPKSNTSRCCGLKSYDYTKDLCCNGKTMENANDGKSLCCGDRIYNTEKEMCCGDNVLPMNDKKTASCCYYGFGGLDIGVTIIKETYIDY